MALVKSSTLYRAHRVLGKSSVLYMEYDDIWDASLYEVLLVVVMSMLVLTEIRQLEILPCPLSPKPLPGHAGSVDDRCFRDQAVCQVQGMGQFHMSLFLPGEVKSMLRPSPS